MQHKNSQRQLARRARDTLQSTKVRFILVGISNTLIDFVVFNIFVNLLHTGLIEANIISTTIAMIASYLMNKQAVFRNSDRSLLQVVLFLTVTLTGIWVVQTLIMYHVFNFLQSEVVTQGHPWLVWFLQNVAKAVGIAAGAVWNYLGYSRIVFRSKKPGAA